MSKSAHTHQNAREPTMNKPSERIVVFVTPAQKRAITSTAEGLGISVSELMRRAVLSFGATSEQVKAASIVDRLRAPREPDALNEALRKVARGTRHAQALPPGLVRPAQPHDPAPFSDGASGAPAAPTSPVNAGSRATSSVSRARAAFEETRTLADEIPDEDAPPFDPATATEEEMRNAAEAVARVAAAKAATLAAHPNGAADPAHPRSSRRPEADDPDDGAPHPDPTGNDGRFA